MTNQRRMAKHESDVSSFGPRHSFAIPPSNFLVGTRAADNLGVLGDHPRWSVLEHYQETITHDEFTRLINDVYCTHGFAPDLIEINEKTARILMTRATQKFFTL